jgi:hypothetical protein
VVEAMNKVAGRTGDRGPVRLDLSIDSNGQAAFVAALAAHRSPLTRSTILGP